MATGAIITADIVNSTLLSSREEKKLIGQLQEVMESHKFEFYRGDSFQVYLKEPDKSLVILLRLRSVARAFGSPFDVRASIGIGDVKTGMKKLTTETGEAFILSGRAFDEMKNAEDRLVIRSADKATNNALKIIAYFVDFIFQDLTPKQAEVFSVLLSGNTQQGAAKKLKKSQSTVNKHAQAAGWPELHRLITEYENLVQNK